LKVVFYYLSAFRSTGGIEKFNRCFIKALNDLAPLVQPSIVSVYDDACNDTYTDSKHFKAFSQKRSKSLVHIVKAAFKNDVIVLGHINLAVAGVLIKLIRPKCKVVMVAHGIEVWGKMYFLKKWCLQKADMILSVSNYTKNQLVLRNQIDPSKIKVFPNTIDPHFDIPTEFKKPGYLLDRYNFKPHQPVILTISRLVSTEQYKGYDKVIASLPYVLNEFPDAIYILAGKYDVKEKARIDQLLNLYHVTDNVILTGYVADNEITDHYKLADVFIMPSRKEGFGIVFLEALVCGTEVIGGNQDGTVDALQNGALGNLINPTKVNEIATAIIDTLKNRNTIQSNELQKGVLEAYGFPKFRSRLEKVLN
jgi:phosphatidylinositol alpha-1,6-mannosyltransferase